METRVRRANRIQKSLSVLILFGAVASGMGLAHESAQSGLTIRAQKAPGLAQEMIQSAQRVYKEGLAAGMSENGFYQRPGQTTPVVNSAQPINPPSSNQTLPQPPQNPNAGAFVPSEVEVFNEPAISKHGHPRAVVHTSLGDIVIKLEITQAPKTVKNFMELAHGDIEFVDVKTSRRVRRPFYDGLTIHKVLPNSFIQMGCPFGNGRGGPGYNIPDEISKTLKFDRPGVVAMALARDGVKSTQDSSGSQFFITLEPQPKWNGQFTIFGEVESGLDIVRKISNAEAGPTDRPIRRIYTTSVEVKDDESGPTHLPASVTAPALMDPQATTPAKP